jgi:hypothetical protein
MFKMVVLVHQLEDDKISCKLYHQVNFYIYSTQPRFGRNNGFLGP